MITIITITVEQIRIIENNFYDYSGEDRILKNIISGDYEIFYSGQNQGILDHKLIDSVNETSLFMVYYRTKSNSPFIFLGSTNYSSIIKERTIGKGINSLPNERLQIRLVIPIINIKDIKINSQFNGIGKYKKAVLQHSNFNTNVNLHLGFYSEV
jgi:hypothetical protein